jgi:hypothetical protein
MDRIYLTKLAASAKAAVKVAAAPPRSALLKKVGPYLATALAGAILATKGSQAFQDYQTGRMVRKQQG